MGWFCVNNLVFACSGDFLLDAVNAFCPSHGSKAQIPVTIPGTTQNTQGLNSIYFLN